MPLRPGETLVEQSVRFRTLGCYPLTGGFESSAATLDDIVAEMRASRSSERHGRRVDHYGARPMGQKKHEGLF